MQSGREQDAIVSVVIATINRRDELRDTLYAYKQQTYPHVEIVVIDNGSRDGTREMMAEEFPDVLYEWLPYNMGTHAINIGFERAKGSILWLSNNDSYPEANTCFEQIVSLFERFPHVHIVGTEDVEMNDGGKVYHWHPLVVDKSAMPPDGFVTNNFHGTGAAVRREVLDAIGGFWDSFIFEEMDFCTRAIVAGFSVRYVPSIRTLHFGSPRSRVQVERRLLAAKNMMRYTWRYFPFFRAVGRTAVYWVVYTLYSGLHLAEPLVLLEMQHSMAATVVRTLRRERTVIPAHKLRDVTLGQGVVWPVVQYIGIAIRRNVLRWRKR